MVSDRIQCEVAVVGAGAAGAAAALALSRAGLHPWIFDARPDSGQLFRAEKLEPDQIAAAGRLGALELIERAGVSIPDVVDARDGVILSREPRHQIGLRYEGIAAVLGQALPADVVRRVDRVERITADDAGATLKLGSGTLVHTKLAVLASGGTTSLVASLGIKTRVIEEYRSTTFGFDVACADGRPFPHPALTVYPHGPLQRAAYVSFFAVPGATRANIFTYLDPKDPAARALRADPLSYLREAFPNIERLTGPLAVTSRVVVGPIELTATVEPARPSVVLVGDAFQTVCPATGTGLAKSFRDAETLARHAPRWLQEGGASVARVQEHYADPEKRKVDRASIEAALYRRRVTLDDSLRMRLHRQKSYAEMRVHSSALSRASAAVGAFFAWLGSG